ncbi:hypothetical protein [Acidianus sp. HS-5]|uniref:hypothetical protein n=1 Tax=Acidianus sp. HS-5 TaxID=2886040 RepID=UPI001F33657C|nr:hypothetical protein [Acidianus sp. HS-5]BDC17322.1 hypothetical protein HS5_02120 [Acidianus sp. HS-5]
MMRINNYSWVSIYFSSLALIATFGVNFTLGRITYTGYFINCNLARMFLVFSAIFMALNYGYYLFLIPISLLSYVIPPEFISPLIFLISLTTLKNARGLKTIFLIADSLGITYLIFYIFHIYVNYLVLPLILIQDGFTPIIIPLMFLGIIYGLGRKIKYDALRIPWYFPFIIVLLIVMLPLTPLNIFHYPETVDWRFYYQWLIKPELGWFFYSRPLYLSLLFALSKLVNALTLSQLEMIPLSILYLFSAYNLGNSLQKGLGPLSALMAAVSPSLLTFLYSGLDSNLFSISLFFLSLSYLINGKLKTSIALSYVALLSHVYAWAQLEGGVILYIIAERVIFHDVKKTYLDYVKYTSPMFVIGIALILTGILPVPFGDSFNNIYSQLSILSWGTANAFLYYAISIYGLDGTHKLIYSLYVTSILAIIPLSVVQNLIIDIPFFIPAAIGISKLKNVGRSILLFFIIWGLYMSLNSFPYIYKGVSI